MSPMNWEQSCRNRLPEYLDARGDLTPPWAQFPTYERYTIGWRMGSGEDWMGLWHVFLKSLGSPEARLGYLRRHPPAPETWANMIHNVLYPPAGKPTRSDDDEPEIAEQRRAALRSAGLIASDVAYRTWLAQQEGVRWPWEECETPEDAARYWTRDLWFWSRQVEHLREGTAWTLPVVPDAWHSCAESLRTGELPDPDPRAGLLTLARMLAAGRVIPPWRLGLTIADFANTFDMDMRFTDAFRHWGMSAFDDREQLQKYLAEYDAPETWARWCEEQFLML